MTEEQKIQAIEAAILRYRAEMGELKRRFNAEVNQVLLEEKSRKLKEIRKNIA
jgi:hypothetical protein